MRGQAQIKTARLSKLDHCAVFFLVILGPIFHPTFGHAMSLPGQQRTNTLQVIFSFPAPSYNATESQPSVTIPVIRSGAFFRAADNISFTSAGTAKPGIDYVDRYVLLHFNPGQISNTFKISLLHGNRYAGFRDFSVGLQLPAATAQPNLGAIAHAQINLVDDQGAGIISLQNTNIISGALETNTVITIIRSFGGKPAAVDYTTADGTALGGKDYSARKGTLFFKSGEISRTVFVPLTHLTGPDVYFYFQLSNPKNGAVLGDANAAGITIQNGGIITLGETNILSDLFDKVATINILRTNGSAPTSVNYATSDGTASAGTDYVSTVGTLFFGLNETNKTILVPVTHFTSSDKLFHFILSNPQSKSLLGLPYAADITIRNPSPLQSILTAGGFIKFSSNASFTVSNYPLVLSGTVVLDANGYDVAFSGSNMARIFNIASNANVTLSGLRLTDGNCTNGGALYNDHGTVLITNCTFSNNVALGTSSVPVTGLPGDTAEGGAIYNVGVMTIISSLFNENSSRGGTGDDLSYNDFGAAGPTSGGDADGGAIFNTGSLLVSNCVFAFNMCQGANGGDNYVVPFWGAAQGGSGQGGAIATATPINIISSSFASNSAIGGQNGSTFSDSKGTHASGTGGAIAGFQNGSISVAQCLFSANVALGGASPTNVDNDGHAGMGGAIYALTNAILADCMFCNNCAYGSDGGSRPTDTYYQGFNLIFQSPGGDGGGAYGGAAFTAASLFVSNCNFIANSALAGNGGTGAIGGSYSLDPFGPTYPGETGGTGGPGIGGAIAAYGRSTLMASLFLSNTAQGAHGGKGGNGITGIRGPASNGGNGANGGGAHGGGVFFSNVITILNCTLANNQAIAGDGGNGGLGGSYNPFYPSLPSGADGAGGTSLGGAANFVASPCDLSFLTVVSNAVHAGLSGHTTLPSTNSDAIGGGLYVNNSGLNLRSSILAFNFTDNYSGPLIDGGGNFSTDANGTFTQPNSFNNMDPKLGPLGDYGGSTWTFSLLPGSPAIDAAGTTDCPPFDQRGFPRPFGAACDSGAFETQ